MPVQMPSIGEMDQRVQLYAATTTKNSFKETVTTYELYSTVWAKVESLNGDDILWAQTIASHLSIRIWIRYIAGFNTSYQVVWRDTTYFLASVSPHGRKQFLELIAGGVQS